MGGIECSALEGGCRNNEMIEDIEKCLNTKLKQEISCAGVPTNVLTYNKKSPMLY